VARLRVNIGASDRVRLDQYLDDIRELERRLQLSEKHTAVELSESSSAIGIPESFEEHVRLMFDLMTLALRSEITRVSTLMLGSSRFPSPSDVSAFPEETRTTIIRCPFCLPARAPVLSPKDSTFMPASGLKGGRHIRADHQPMANILLSMLGKPLDGPLRQRVEQRSHLDI
jgi:hypothetical protein